MVLSIFYLDFMVLFCRVGSDDSVPMPSFGVRSLKRELWRLEFRNFEFRQAFGKNCSMSRDLNRLMKFVCQSCAAFRTSTNNQSADFLLNKWARRDFPEKCSFFRPTFIRKVQIQEFRASNRTFKLV